MNKLSNPYRDRDTPIAQMLGISVNGWYTRLSPEERKMYRNIWFHTPEQDRQLPPGEWQLKYLGYMFIPPSPPTKRAEYLSDGHGNPLVRRPDGTEEITLWREGVTIITRPDGVREIIFEHPDITTKWMIRITPTGIRENRRYPAPCSPPVIRQQEWPNGKIITNATNGAIETQYPNGVTILQSRDGSTEMREKGKITTLAPAIPEWNHDCEEYLKRNGRRKEETS